MVEMGPSTVHQTCIPQTAPVYELGDWSMHLLYHSTFLPSREYCRSGSKKKKELYILKLKNDELQRENTKSCF